MSVVDFTHGVSDTEHEELEDMVLRLERDCWDEYVVEVRRIFDRPVEWVPASDRCWLPFVLLHELGHSVLPSVSSAYVGAEDQSPSAEVSNEIVVREPTEVSTRFLFEDATKAWWQVILDEANVSSSFLLWDAFNTRQFLLNPVPKVRWADGFRVLLSSFETFRSEEESSAPNFFGTRRLPSASGCWTTEAGQLHQNTRWTEEKNQRRCDLVDKEIEEALTPEEAVELEQLQKEMLAYRREVAPLPIEEARRVHDELLKKAATKQE